LLLREGVGGRMEGSVGRLRLRRVGDLVVLRREGSLGMRSALVGLLEEIWVGSVRRGGEGRGGWRGRKDEEKSQQLVEKLEDEHPN